MRPGQGVVHLQLELVAVHRMPLGHLEELPGKIGQRHELILNHLGRGIESVRRDHAAGECQPREGIVGLDRRSGEIALPLQRRGHDGGVLEIHLPLPEPRVTAEVERAIFTDS